MKLVESKQDKYKVLREDSELSNLSLLIGIPLIPVGLFIIGVVIWLFISPSDLLQALPNLLKLLFTLIIIFAMLGYAVLRRVHANALDAIRKPWLLTVRFLINIAIFAFLVEPPFTEHEIADFKNNWQIILAAWLLFSILENNRVRSYVNQTKLKSRLFWILRAPIWTIVFFTGLMFVIVDGVALFAKIFNLIMCSIATCT
jgi:hypothetical protein